MAKPGLMIPIVANGLAIRAATVTSHYRVLREAGLVTRVGRGRYGADVTATDLARLLLTLMGSDSLEEAPAVCQLLCRARCSVWDEENNEEESASLEEVTAAILVRFGSSPDQGPEKKGPFWSNLTVIKELRVFGTELEATVITDSGELPFQVWSDPLPASVSEDWENLTVEDRLVARSQFAHLVTMRSLHATHLYDIAKGVL